jgi:hypothetical protein
VLAACYELCASASVTLAPDEIRASAAAILKIEALANISSADAIYVAARQRDFGFGWIGRAAYATQTIF